MNKSYCIYGASGHSKVIIEIIEKAGNSIKGLFDDDPLKKKLLDYEVSNESSIFDLQGVAWIIGIGDDEPRRRLLKIICYPTISPSTLKQQFPAELKLEKEQ